MSTENNKAIVMRDLKEVLEQGHVELLESYYAPDGSEPKMWSLEMYRDTVRFFHKTCPGFKITILNMMAEGEKVMAHYQCDLTYSVPGDPAPTGLPPLGKPVTWQNFDVSRIVDGKLVWQQNVSGWADMLIEIGVISSPDIVDKNKAVVTRHFKEVIEQGRVDLIPSYFGPDGTTTNLPSMQGMKDAVLWHHKHCPGFTVTLLDLMAEGDKVIANIQYDMTYSVPVDPPEIELSPLGKPFTFRNMNVFTIVNGRMVGESPVHGMTDALIAMGAIPSPDKVEENKAAVRKFVDAVNRQDAALLVEVCTPEAAKGWIEALPGIYAQMKDHHIELVDMVADGEGVAIKMATSGYHTGEMHGLPASGKWWTNRVFAFVRFVDGKVAEVDLQPDIENIIQQIGGVIRPAA